MKKIKEMKHFFVTVIGIFALVFYFGLSTIVNSGSADNMTGFAWGADWFTAGGSSSLGGMGWLSFNSTNDHDPNAGGVQPSPYNYGVDVDDAGNITGFAWAGNSIDSSINGIGWIRFGGLSGFPSGPGTTPVNAKVVNGTVIGWARVCSVLTTANCTGNTLKPSSSTGGWDGWISLSGSGYEVTLNENSGAFSGFAWGGPDVLGWVNFSQVFKGVPNPPPPSGSLTLSPDSPVVYPPNYQTTLRWRSSVPLTGCKAKNNAVPPTSTWSGDVSDPTVIPAPETSKQIYVPASSTSIKYDLKCFNGTTEVNAPTVSITRGTLPEDLTFKNTTPVNSGGIFTTTLSWITTNMVPGSCVATGGWSGAKTTLPTGSQNGTGSESGVVVPAISPRFTRYTLTCTGFYTGQPKSVDLDLNEKSGGGGTDRAPVYKEE